jgi:L-seryl-tRNA(Ser) seleniumtransferase
VTNPDLQARLRALPSVDRLAAAIADGASLPGAADEVGAVGGAAERERSRVTVPEAVVAARAVLAERRGELLGGACDGGADLVARGRAWLAPTLRRVLNGTGVVIHTNLGRAPLAESAARAVADAARGYSNVELELESGRRGSRHAHVAELLRELTGAEDAIAVNNGAGATLLAIAAVAGPGGAVAVSRGQLVEIGGGFRVPDVLAQARARMIEVGTTNRTRLADYERVIERAAGPERGAATILRVHQSNFRTVGFVEEVAIEPLCGLGVPVIDDVGSGALASGLEALADEPPVARSIAAGAAVVCFSGDKLLGGPQAGILVGRAAAIEACRQHPLARALRIGRLPLAGLAATLALYRDPARARRELPVLAMLDIPPALLRARAERLAGAAGDTGRAEIVDAVARVGGGALPLLELTGPAVALGVPGEDPAALARALRTGDPPLLPRIADGRVLVDPRTLADDELEAAAGAIAAALVEQCGSTVVKPQ